MPLLHVVDVLELPTNSDGILGWSLESPTAGFTSDTYTLDVSGWVLARGPNVAVEMRLSAEERSLRSVFAKEERPDVQHAFPELVGAQPVGFGFSISLLGLPREFEVELEASFGGGEHVRLARVRGIRRLLTTRSRQTFSPLMLTSLGRTGSSWMVRVLGEHPEILAYRPFQCETRFCSYGLDVFGALTEPTGYTPAVTFANVAERGWWLDGDRFWSQLSIPDDALRNWLGKTRVERVAEFTIEQVDGFYAQVAQMQRKTEAQYFVEKFIPNHVPLLAREIYPMAKEVFLVRDFRDVFCSIVAFEGKRRTGVFFGDPSLGTGSKRMQDLRCSAVELLNAWQSRSRSAYLLRYEDVMLRPRDVLTDLFRFLGIDSSRRMVEQVIEHARDPLPDQADHMTSPDVASSIGRWQNDLSPELQVEAREAFSSLLEEFGYPPDRAGASEPTAAAV